MPASTPPFHKTRIAPTPSGYLHLGNVLSFATTAALAQKSGAKILLRIDDLDQARANPQYIQDIFDTLNFLEIPWQAGPRDAADFAANFSQIHRLPLYKEAFNQLAENGLVYACTCSRKQLQNDTPCVCFEKKFPLSTPDASWRLLTDNQSALSVKTYSGEIIKAVLPFGMQNFVVRKKDGYPAYQLTSIIDDVFYGVDLIVRGDDLWESTLAQQQLALALNETRFGGITFYHHPLLMESGDKKLSKSAGATSVKYLRESGKSKADIYGIIGGMLGVEAPIKDWQQLRGAAIKIK